MSLALTANWHDSAESVLSWLAPLSTIRDRSKGGAALGCVVI